MGDAWERVNLMRIELCIPDFTGEVQFSVKLLKYKGIDIRVCT